MTEKWAIAATGALDAAGKLCGTVVAIRRQDRVGRPAWSSLATGLPEFTQGGDAHLHLVLLQGGTPDGSPERVLWRGPGGRSETISLDALEHRLNGLIFAERPALLARAHFIVPLQLDAAPGGNDQDANEAYLSLIRSLLERAGETESEIKAYRLPPDAKSQSERTYYLPHLHRLLAPDGSLPAADRIDGFPAGEILSFRTCAFDGAELTRHACLRTPVAGEVQDVLLHCGPERTLLLEWSIEVDGAAPDMPLWRAILSAGEGGPGRSLAAWLDIAHSVRTTYDTYVPTEAEQARAARLILEWAGGSIPIETLTGPLPPRSEFRAPLVGLVDRFLRAFLPPVSDLAGLPEAGTERLERWFEYRFDERARLISTVIPAGEEVPDAAPPALVRDIYESRLLGGEEWQDCFYYNEDFARAEIAAAAYDRFRGMGARYLIDDHSFALIGYGKYARNVLGEEHMRHLYPPMARLLHLNAAVLNGFSRELARIAADWPVDAAAAVGPDPLTERFSALKGRFLRFFALHWFERVSSQMQGEELFDRLLAASGARRELELVQSRIGEAQSFFDARARARAEQLERRKEDMVRFIATAVPIVGVGGLLLAMLGAQDPVGLENVLQRAFARLPGGAAEWRYEIAGYATILLAWVLVAIGFARLPSAEQVGRDEQARRSRPVRHLLFLLAMLAAAAAPAAAHAGSGAGWLAAAGGLVVASLLLTRAALPGGGPAAAGSEIRAVRRLVALAVAAVAAAAAAHARLLGG